MKFKMISWELRRYDIHQLNIRKQYLAAGFVVVVGLSAIAIYTIVTNQQPQSHECPPEISDLKTALACPAITGDEKLTELLQTLWKEVRTGCEDPDSESCCHEDGSVSQFSFVGSTLSFEYANMTFCKGNAYLDIANEASYIWDLKASRPLQLDNELEIEKLKEYFWRNVDPQSKENYPPGEENGGCLEESEVMELTAEIRQGGLNGGTAGPFFRFAKDANGPYLQMSVHPTTAATRACALKLNLRQTELQPFLRHNSQIESLVFR